LVLWDVVSLIPAVIIWAIAGAAARITHDQVYIS
jgi:hypothetical protein